MKRLFHVRLRLAQAGGFDALGTQGPHHVGHTLPGVIHDDVQQIAVGLHVVHTR